MALTVTHTFVSAIADDPVALAAGEVCPQSHWNATHTVSGSLPPGGSNSQVQYNASGTLGGSAGILLSAALITAMTMGLGSDATGDIYYNSGAGVVARLPVGTGTQVLGVSGGLPAWVAPSTGAVSSVSNSDGTLTISPTTGAVVASIALGHANIWSGVQTYNNSNIKLLGSSTGATTFTSANASATNFTLTLPAVNDTVAVLGTAQTFSATQTFSGTLNVSGTFQKSGNTMTFPGVAATLAGLAVAQTWSAAQTFNNNDLVLAGSTSGTTTLNATATASGTLTLPAATDTLVARATTDTLTNKTLSSTTDVLGGVTMTLGSDATGDIYYRSSTGVLTRLGIGSGTQVLGITSGLPAWVAGGGGGVTGSGTAGQVAYWSGSTALTGDAGMTYTAGGQLVLALGTITANAKGLNLTATWNNVAVTFDAPLFLSVTSTASATASKLFDFQGNNSTNSGSFMWANSDGTVFINQYGQAITGFPFQVQFQGNTVFQIGQGGNVLLSSAGGSKPQLQLPNLGSAVTSGGFGVIAIPVANNWGISQGTTAQGWRVYNTTDNDYAAPTNYERGVFDWTTASNVLTIGPQAGGTKAPLVRYMQQSVAFASQPPTTKTANYSQTLADEWLIFNGAGSLTLTLLSAATYPGLELYVLTIAAQTVVSATSNVIPRAGGSAGTAILAGAAGNWALLVSNGTNWQIVAGTP